MDFPQFQSAKWDIYEERYSEKTNYSKHMFSSVTCSLHSSGCNSYFEICWNRFNFCNDKSFKKIGIFQLDALHCKFTLIQ